VAHTYNPRFLGGGDQEDCDSKPAWENSFQDPILKIPNTKKSCGANTISILLKLFRK
jgi:hypothetical protein